MGHIFKRIAIVSAAALGIFLGGILAQTGHALALGDRPAGVPKAGESKRIDEIIKRGTLRIGVLASYPWLFRNKMPEVYGNSDPWRGSSWILAKAYAKALGVKLELVDVSNETKVQLVAAGGIDVTSTALAPSPERAKVVDFVPYSTGAMCVIGLKNNPKFVGLTKPEQLNDPKMTFAAFIGTVQQTWIPKEFPKANLRTVTGSGAGAIEEVLSGRSDLSAFDNPEWPKLQFAYPGRLVSFPADCQHSPLGAHPVANAVAKNEPVFLEFLRSVATKMHDQLDAEDQLTFKFALEHPDKL